MRPKSKIYTPKRDDEHPRLFHMEVPPPGVHVSNVRVLVDFNESAFSLKGCVNEEQTYHLLWFSSQFQLFSVSSVNGSSFFLLAKSKNRFL